MSVKAGARIAFVDDCGVTWFGVAVTDVKETERWPVVLIEIGSRRLEVPARDVTLWPTPEALREHRRKPELNRESLNVRAVTNARSPFLCKIGDPVVMAETVDRSIPQRIRYSSTGVIAGVTSSGNLIVRFSTAQPAARSTAEHSSYCKRLA